MVSERSSSAIQHVIIENVGSDLRVRGQEENTFRIESDEATEVRRDENEGTVFVNSPGECSIAIPSSANLTIENIGSDAKITNLTGDLTIGNTGSDLILKGIGNTTIRQAGDDASIKGVNGNLTIMNVGDDLSVRSVQGNLEIESIGGDFVLREVSGSARVANVGGDILLDIAFAAGNDYVFGAGGDIVCQLQPDTAVTFILPTGTRIETGPFASALIDDSTEDGRLRVHVGEGGPEVTITHVEDFALAEHRGSKFTMDFSFDLGEQIGDYVSGVGDEITRNMADIGDMINEQMSNLGDIANETAERIRERVTNQMEHKAKRAQWRVEQRQRQAERARRRAERMQRRGRSQAADEWEPVTTDERRMVLGMVEAGKISVEEAERLLKTLEGE
jgi:ElaB/YqjD/DUF883 family membrane-anchored ribosome-binding protein